MAPQVAEELVSSQPDVEAQLHSLRKNSILNALIRSSTSQAPRKRKLCITGPLHTLRDNSLPCSLVSTHDFTGCGGIRFRTASNLSTTSHVARQLAFRHVLKRHSFSCAAKVHSNYDSERASQAAEKADSRVELAFRPASKSFLLDCPSRTLVREGYAFFDFFRNLFSPRGICSPDYFRSLFSRAVQALYFCRFLAGFTTSVRTSAYAATVVHSSWNPAPQGRNIIAQHAAAGGVLGSVGERA